MAELGLMGYEPFWEMVDGFPVSECPSVLIDESELKKPMKTEEREVIIPIDEPNRPVYKRGIMRP